MTGNLYTLPHRRRRRLPQMVEAPLTRVEDIHRAWGLYGWALPLLGALLGACASHSGVVPIGSGVMMITKQAGTGFPGLGNMKAEVMQEASSACASQGKQFEVTNYTETKAPYILGNFPRVELQFRCV